MIVETRAVTAGETAHLLQKHLGSMRQWGSFLADCIRNRQHIEGYQLIPCGKKSGAGGLAPMYSLESIATFIRAVRDIKPRPSKPIRAVKLKIDTAKSWRHNRFDREGFPVAMYRAPVSGTTGTAIHG
jgi:hypothetical protein